MTKVEVRRKRTSMMNYYIEDDEPIIVTIQHPNGGTSELEIDGNTVDVFFLDPEGQRLPGMPTTVRGPEPQ